MSVIIIFKNINIIIEGPFYKGVAEYAGSNVVIKLVAHCKEEDRFQVQRDMNREYRKIFNENGIDFSYDQVVINEPEIKTFDMSKINKKETKAFLDQQKEISKNYEEQTK